MKLTKRGKIVKKIMEALLYVIVGIIFINILIIGFDRESERIEQKNKKFIEEQGFIFDKHGNIVGTYK